MQKQEDAMQGKPIEGFPPSPQQKRLWLLQQQDCPAYRAQCALVLEGNLQPERLDYSLQRVVHRHEILRTIFHLPAGRKVPFQVVADSGVPSWHNVDLTDLSPEEQEIKINELLQSEGDLPFDFEQGPLLRLRLVTLSEHKSVLLISLPSLCADIATLKNLAQEISRFYAAGRQNEEAAEEPFQYADFSAWHNELLEDHRDETGREYWRRRRLGAGLKLPFERQPSTESGFRPECFAVTAHSDVAAKIEEAARRYDTSVSIFLLATWQILLWRLTGQSDLIVGTVFEGRKFDELQGALGLFAQSLPIHCHLEQDSPFQKILEQTHGAIGDAHKWQEYFAWEQAVGSSENGAGASFFSIGFEFQQRPPAYPAGGMLFSIYRQSACIDRFTIKLCCVHAADSLTMNLHYDSNSFSVGDIQRLAGQLQTLLDSILDTPQAAIGRLEILGDVERRQQLLEFNDTRTEYRKNTCIHQLFEEQAELTPHNVAVVFEDRRLTYAELNGRANQVARHLRALGVGAETLVAICMERSLDMVIGMLGILKAGAAYVPLDPALPHERLAFLLEDTQASVLLTQNELLEGVPAPGIRRVSLDADWDEIAKHGNTNLPKVEISRNLAYVLFTSGSTGKPKGIAVEHRQLLNYVEAIVRRLDLPVGASFATVSTFAADLGNTAIFPALCTGGCLHVISQDRASDPDALADYFARNPIDCLKIVPSHLEVLLAFSRPERVLPRKRLVLGGEACSWALIEKVQALVPDCVILNHYGPTETTVGVLTYQWQKVEECSRSATVPIGRPIGNTEIYLLDGELKPVPVWTAGELYVAGESLSRGYLNRPELTAEKFIPNPFGTEPGSRLYKTGDLTRYLPDGNIEFLGRIDNQVKIRGFRIEPGEVEAVLSQHPAVRETVIIARDEVHIAKGGSRMANGEDANPQSAIRNPQSSEKRLVAYVVPAGDLPPAISELRGFLKSRLPEHMIPAAFVTLRSLPLTPNGKVDRKALPAPDQSRPDLQDSFVPPRNLTEKAIAEIWAQVLRVERVGVHDDFFDLGGHSLLATQVVSRIRKTLQIELSLRCLFENPTVASLAVQIVHAQEGKLAPEAMADLVAGLELLSDQEAQRLLAQENPSSSLPPRRKA